MSYGPEMDSPLDPNTHFWLLDFQFRFDIGVDVDFTSFGVGFGFVGFGGLVGYDSLQ